MIEMNRYNNNVGYHTPFLSEKHKKEIDDALGFTTLDVSWHNDTCDSIELRPLEFLIEDVVFLPNGTDDDPDEEKFNTFYHERCKFQTSDIKELIKHLKDKGYECSRNNKSITICWVQHRISG